MDIHEITNGEVEFKLDDKCYKVKRLSLYELSFDVEKQIKDEYYANVQKLASMLTGKEKIDYIQSVKELTDEEVTKLVVAKSNTFRGRCEELFKILSKCQKVTMQDVEALLMDEKYWTLVAAIQEYALSGKLKKEEDTKSVVDKTAKKK